MKMRRKAPRRDAAIFAFSHRLKMTLRTHHLTEAELSQATGIPRSTISRYLHDRLRFSPRRRALIESTLAPLLGLSAGECCVSKGPHPARRRRRADAKRHAASTPRPSIDANPPFSAAA
jgi:transcriptional regulator with XRE-family HTH domain